MNRSHFGIVALSLMMSAPAVAGVTLIDFEETDIQGDFICDYYADRGIKFDGLLFNDVDYGDFNFEESRVRDLRGMWGSDVDSEAVASGFGVTSVTIGFEATMSAFEDLSFSIARMMDQDITVIARDAVSGELYSRMMVGVETNEVTERTVEQVFFDFNAMFEGFGSGKWIEVAVHNHGGFFGIDDVSYLPSTPVVPGVAPALAGMAGLVGLRRRRR